jgi:PAS domain S-box-containing protein
MKPNRNASARDVILDSINEGVFTVGLDWRITSFNRAAERIVGVKRGEAMGRPCCEVLRADVCEGACVLRLTLSTGKPAINVPVHIISASGRRTPIRVSTALLQDATGKVIGGVETFQDLSQVEALRKELQAGYTLADIIGRSAAMQELFRALRLVAASDSTALIEGPSGTGKELAARALHSLSPRRRKPFVAVNCGALPDSLLESELFGYKAGAFTDARRDKPGLFAAAAGGTLFLDEIGDVSPAMQVRLLRVLQDRTYTPLGGTEPVRGNLRVVCATNKDLGRMVRKGEFREDLFYRIRVIRLALPPLRDRREDIPLLIEHFVTRFNRLQGKDVAGVDEEVLATLMDYDFPGNVRELENTIEHAFVLCRTGLIRRQHLPPELRGEAPDAAVHLAAGASLNAVEQAVIRGALARHHGNRRATARELGIDPSTLYRKLKTMAAGAQRSRRAHHESG